MSVARLVFQFRYGLKCSFNNVQLRGTLGSTLRWRELTSERRIDSQKTDSGQNRTEFHQDELKSSTEYLMNNNDEPDPLHTESVSTKNTVHNDLQKETIVPSKIIVSNCFSDEVVNVQRDNEKKKEISTVSLDKNGIPPSFEALIKALKECNDISDVSELIIQVYTELMQHNDWKTGLILYRLLNKHPKIEITPSFSAEISYILLQTYVLSRKTGTNCAQFLERLKYEGLVVDIYGYILAYRKMILDPYIDNLQSLCLLKMREHEDIPEALGVIMLHYAKIGDINKVSELYLKSLRKMNDKLPEETTNVVDALIFVFKNTDHNKSFIENTQPWFIDHTLIMTLTLLNGLMHRLYDPYVNKQKSTALDLNGAELMLHLCIYIIKNTISSNEKYPYLYKTLPSISTLDILRKTIISVLRTSMKVKSIESLNATTKLFRVISDYDSGVNKSAGYGYEINKCIDLALSICMVDYLDDVRFSIDISEYVSPNLFFDFGTRNWGIAIVNRMRSIYNIMFDKNIPNKIIKDMEKSIYPGSLNADYVYKHALKSGSELLIKTLSSISTNYNSTPLCIDKSDFPTIIIKLASNYLKENISSFTFFENTIYSSFDFRSNIPLSYYKAVLKYYASNYLRFSSSDMYFHVVHEVSNIIYRIRMSNHKLDAETFTHTFNAISSYPLKHFIGDRTVYASKIMHQMLRIISYLNLFIEKTQEKFDDEFIYAIIRVGMLLKIILEFRSSPSGSLFVATEFRFELTRYMENSHVEWTPEIVDAVLDCCLFSGSTSAAMSFISSKLKYVAHDSLLKLLKHLQLFGSLCEAECIKVQLWMENAENKFLNNSSSTILPNKQTSHPS